MISMVHPSKVNSVKPTKTKMMKGRLKALTLIKKMAKRRMKSLLKISPFLKKIAKKTSKIQA
jgi:hypothetical protein